jgi:hypothetical protein
MSVLLMLVGCAGAVSEGQAGPSSSPTPSTPSPSLSSLSPTTQPVPATLPLPTQGPPETPGDRTPQVVWRGDRLEVTTFGSRLCQPVARSSAAADEHTVIVTFQQRADEVPCTDVFAPNRSRIAAPTGGIDLGGQVYATLDLAGAARQRVRVKLHHPSFS